MPGPRNKRYVFKCGCISAEKTMIKSGKRYIIGCSTHKQPIDHVLFNCAYCGKENTGRPQTKKICCPECQKKRNHQPLALKVDLEGDAQSVKEPGATLAEIGYELGVSTERARQILNRAMTAFKTRWVRLYGSAPDLKSCFESYQYCRGHRGGVYSPTNLPAYEPIDMRYRIAAQVNEARY